MKKNNLNYYMSCLKIGHRGMRGHAKDNTIEGFKCAFNNGMDAIEVDIRKTSDDDLILFHDKFININGVDTSIDTLTLAEVTKFDADIISLYIFLKTIPVNRGKIFFDIKKCDNDKNYIRKFMSTIKFFLLQGWDKSNFFYQSYYAPYIQNLSDQRETFHNLGIIYDGMPLNYFSDLKDVYGTYICLNWKSIDDEDIRDIAEESHLDVYLHTINDKNTYQRFKKLLVDGIITDNYEIFIN